MSFKRLQIRIYPTKEQQILLNKHIIAYRYLYNLCLEYKIYLYKYHKINISGFAMQSEIFNIIKEISWLKNLKVECLRQAALDVADSFKKFYKGNGFPKFKSKKTSKNSFTSNQTISIKNNKLKWFKQKIKFRTSKEYTKSLSLNEIKQCTFIKEKDGTWFASCLIKDNNLTELPFKTKKIGIDLGLTHFITTSEGEFINIPNFFKDSEYKLKKIQRKFSKSKKGGENREKLRIKLAKHYKKVYNQRQHFFHQISNKLIFENQEIHIENLKVKNMLKNKKLSKAITRVSWTIFKNILKYKCIWYNRDLIELDTYFPSSKLCSNCGNKKKELTLLDRIYNCENCGFSCDRDINAAKNLVNSYPTVKNTESYASGDLIRPILG